MREILDDKKRSKVFGAFAIAGHGKGMQLLSIGAVSDITQLSPTTIRTADDELQPLRDSSGKRLYTLESVHAWLAARAARREAEANAAESVNP